MFVYVNLNEVVNWEGKATYFHPEVRVEHSPKEGLDHETIRTLENELQELITVRIQEALHKGGREDSE